MTLSSKLRAYRDADAIGDGDIAAVSMLVALSCKTTTTEPSVIACVAMCLALRTSRDGHTCVDLDRIGEWSGTIDQTARQLDWPLAADDWISELVQLTSLVGIPGERKPFIVDGHRLYLCRSLAEEKLIAEVLSRNNAQHVSVLLGGPGTGKTTEVARLMISRIEQSVTPLRIALAAPTGKAATRMTEVLQVRCATENASAEVLASVAAAPARTIHKLLGYTPYRTPRFLYGVNNPLPYDLIVIDEASMLSSSHMHQLLSSLTPTAEILLVGDPDQLASVESGSVLADIAASARVPKSLLSLRTQELKTQYRFDANSGIAALATAVRAGDTKAAMAVLNENTTDIRWIDPSNEKNLASLTNDIVANAQHLCEQAHGDPLVALATQRRFQVLCAHRMGAMGVAGWNNCIETRLGTRAGSVWYAGRPIMITRNNTALELSNGDVGVVMAPTAGRRIEVVFGQGASIIRVPTTRLEDVATVHALTIHKSQGSEYSHAVVILPERQSPILTRELLYTGITRAINQLTLVGSQRVIASAIDRPIRRASGLTSRL
ncbi:MAG: exodeoxyribonuclease V subunit alpha [Planctomycetia bacterium]|nr:exodeoxyribonuclease V subunit alpha [Planctomycetia bacterium]